MFRDREDAGHQLAEKLKGRTFRNPLVLAIPRGGLVTGAALARELGAELDVVLARPLRVPGQPASSLGAVGEDGSMVPDRLYASDIDFSEAHLADERDFQLSLIAPWRKRFRAVRPPAAIAGRTVIVADDGIATARTMTAALIVIKGQTPHELVVAVPVARQEGLEQIRPRCDELICLHVPSRFSRIGSSFEHFPEVDDGQLVQLFRSSTSAHRK